MSTEALKPAFWVGPFDAEVHDRHTGAKTDARPGDGPFMVTDADLESTHWRAADEPKRKRGKKDEPAPDDTADAGDTADASSGEAAEGAEV